MDDLTPADAEELFEHCRLNPVYFCEEVLGVKLWDKQEQIIESVRDNDNTSVASGHGVGKTFISACTTLWFSCCNDQSR